MQSKWLATVTILVICVFERGYGADEVFRCPDPFIAKEVNTLTLKINKTAVDAVQCALPLRKISFSRSRVSDNPKAPSLPVCDTAYDCVSAGPVTSPVDGSKPKCGCVQKSGGVLTFEMKYIVDKELDKAANFSYQACASPLPKLTQDIQKSCSFVTVADKDQTTGCSPGCIAGITVGVLVLVAVAVGAGIFIMRKRNWKGSPVPT